MAFKSNRDDNHLIVDRIIQESEIAMNGGFLTERELASVGCVQAFGKNLPENCSHFERKGIADLDEIRAHVLAMDNQVRMTREASDRERGTCFVPHHRANPAVDEVFAAVVDENARPCGHCGDDRHSGRKCHRKHGCPDEVLARMRAHNTGGSRGGSRSVNSGRGGGSVAHRANVAESTGGDRNGGWYRQDEEGKDKDGNSGVEGNGHPGTTLPDESYVTVEISGRDLDGFIELFKGTRYPGEEEEQGAAAILDEIFDTNRAKPHFHIPAREDRTSVDWNCHVRDEADRTPVIGYHVDSGSSVHISPSWDEFVDFVEIPPHPIKGVNGSYIHAVGRGTITLRMGKGHKGVLRLVNALYVPRAAIRLISTGWLDLDGLFIGIYNGQLLVKPSPTSDNIIAVAKRLQNNLYVILGSPQVCIRSQRATSSPASCSTPVSLNLPEITADSEVIVNSALAPIDSMTLHHRMGHCSMESVVDMAKHGMVTGMKLSLDLVPPVCKHCILDKQSNVLVPSIRKGQRATKPLEIVYANILVSITVAGRQKEGYVLHIIDDYSSIDFVFPLKKKSDATEVFLTWANQAEVQTKCKLGIIRVDNGREFHKLNFAEYLRDGGVVIQTSAPYTSAQIGRVERAHRTIWSRMRASRAYANLPPNLWPELIITMSYLKNRTPSRALNNCTPYELWFKKKPDRFRRNQISHIFERLGRAPSCSPCHPTRIRKSGIARRRWY